MAPDHGIRKSQPMCGTSLTLVFLPHRSGEVFWRVRGTGEGCGEPVRMERQLPLDYFWRRKSLRNRIRRGYTQGSSSMNARRIIFGALLLALTVSPSALRATSRSMSARSWQAGTPLIHTNYGRQARKSPDKVAVSLPGHRGPAARLHRKRGKKISIERGLAIAQGCSAPNCYLFSLAPVRLQDTHGPNPSRGPPTELSL
jgi:hypothetical protein